ncbi:MAG TPA: class I SAM-dependent methyltransferase [Thermoanaerobaculia bacterium]|nr:class I SAM-dependent methyltransferase [Thermoanaerobaculia bacterium]
MTREELGAEVERLRPWFHAIELPHGLWTKHESAGTEPADHPAGTWEVVRRHLPPDLAGKTVLDVGCGAGFYSVQAKRLGRAATVQPATPRTSTARLAAGSWRDRGERSRAGSGAGATGRRPDVR